MAIVTGQLSASSTPALSTSVVASLPVIPPGVSSFTVSNNSGATVFVGAAPAGTTAPSAATLQADGFPIPTGAPPVTVPGFPASRATQIFIVASGTITGTMGFLISAAN